MASLRARSPLRSAHPLFFINKIVSLAAFIVLLGVGWVALSYLKFDASHRWQGKPSGTVSASKASVIPVTEVSSAEIRPLTAPGRLVYSCATDTTYYHNSTHLPARCQRTAVSEETAVRRGLKRCLVCFPE